MSTEEEIISVESHLRPWGACYDDEQCRRAVGAGLPLDEILNAEVELPLGGGKGCTPGNREWVGAQWLARRDRPRLISWAVGEVRLIPNRKNIPIWDAWVDAGCPSDGAEIAAQAAWAAPGAEGEATKTAREAWAAADAAWAARSGWKAACDAPSVADTALSAAQWAEQPGALARLRAIVADAQRKTSGGGP